MFRIPIFLSVSTTDAGQRLDQFLVQQFQKKYSRSYLQYLIAQGGVLVNGKKIKRHDPVRSGDEIEVILKEKEDRPWLTPEKIPLDIIYEDEEIVVVNKPSGMVVHPACGHYTGTLVHALLAHCGSLSQAGGQTRPGIVHRLDKETSGVILAAKTENAHCRLAEQFASRQVKKKYLAIVRGRVVRQEGVIHLPIGRHPVNRKKMAVIVKGEGRSRQAETRYRVLERFKQATCLELEPTTGRTHQIRVHLSALGHPILGDSVYGGGVPSLKIPRLALHAAAVTFIHPGSGKSLTFQAPVPNDLQELLRRYRFS